MTTTARRGTSERIGYTLLEMVVATGSASVLLLGLASSLFVASSALDDETADGARTEAAEVHATVLADLPHATTVTERTANSVTFVVPDRDGDGEGETLRYAWSGTTGDPLTVEYNGGTATTLLDDVREFGLDYVAETRSRPTVLQSAGFVHAYPTERTSWNDKRVATRITLHDPGTVRSITVYVGGSRDDLRVAVYADDDDEPGTLLVESAVDESNNAMSWLEVDVPDTVLAAGTYWLALSLSESNQRVHTGGGGTLHVVNADAVTGGFPASWGSSGSTESSRLSIYATYVAN